MEAMTLIFVFAAMFMALERVFPGRELPSSPGWYLRAVFLNAVQLGVVVLGGYTWSEWLQEIGRAHV